MSDRVSIHIDDETIEVPAGTSVASAILASGRSRFRISVNGAPRGPVCGMGICFECRVTIDGRPHQRSCNVVCREGMEVATRDA